MTHCPFCHSDKIINVPHTTKGAVTSDCLPYHHSASYLRCENCHGLFKEQTDQWRKNVIDIYESYQLYAQTDGEEQPVFDDKGQALPRSQYILQELSRRAILKAPQKMLDIGCGTGAMLRAFQDEFPHCDIYGQDEYIRDKERLENIPGVQTILTDPLIDLRQSFDTITLIHVLEHVFDPLPFLQDIKKRLTPNGKLIIQVPDVQHNPFDLMVYDHAHHFTPSSLYTLLEKAGFRISLIENLLTREITAVADCHAGQGASRPAKSEAPLSHFELLSDFTTTLENCQSCSIFGTAVAANWLASINEGVINAFLDENPKMAGKQHLSKPVLAPKNGDKSKPVIVPFSQPTRAHIQQKLRALGYQHIL